MTTEARITAKFAKVKQGILDALKAGAEEYANGKFRAKPIVDEHFTAGNQGRYGWAPLSTEYFRWKQGLIPHRAVKAGVFRGSRLDRNVGHATATGAGTGTNLPMLVLTGALRRAVDSRTHSVVVDQSGRAVVTFRNLPEYAVYHHRGTARLPKRSPVEPNEIDRQRVIDAMRRFLDRAFMRIGGAAATSDPLAAR